MKYAYVQIRKPKEFFKEGDEDTTTDCFIILEIFDDLAEIQEIHKGAPYQERYIIIPVYQ